MNPMYDFSKPRDPASAATPAPTPKRPNKPGRRPAKAVLIGGLVAAVLVIGGGALAYSDRRTG